jgi:hypothetical protein
MSVWRVSEVNLTIYLEGRKANESLEPIGWKERSASGSILRSLKNKDDFGFWNMTTGGI